MTVAAPTFESFERAVRFAADLLPHTTYAGAFVFDADYVLVFAEGPVLRDRGYTSDVVVGRRADDVLPASIWRCLKPLYDRTLTGDPFIADHAGTNEGMYRVHGSPILAADGSVAGGLLIAHEAIGAAEERLAERLRQHAAIAELGRMALSRGTGLRDLIRLAVDSVITALSCVDAAGVGELLPGGERFRSHEMGSNLSASEFPVAGSTFKRVLDAGRPLVLVDEGDARFPPYLRESGFVTVASVPIAVEDAPFGAIGAFAREATAFSDDDLHFLRAIANILAEAVRRERADAEFRREAMRDVVTGLPNRQLLADRLEQSIALAQRSGSRVGVLFVDLDRFRVVNDSLGHEAGDAVLRLVAERLRTAVRASDTVGRFGGDEFVIVAPALEDQAEVERIATAVLDVLDEPMLIGDRWVHMRASIGVTLSSAHGRSIDTRALIREADAAMYRAKALGHHRYQVHDPADTEIVDALEVEQGLREALAADELRLAFQPFVRLDESEVCGAEVLLRWQHPTRGLVGPAYFLDVAEGTGLIVPIGAWMIEQACRLARAWHQGDEFLLTVNLSATQLADPAIVETVGHALRASGLPPHCLGLELTEQVLVGDEDLMLQTLHGLKDLGVKLLLDDFGTGYSSLSHLKRFPIDIVKIDRSFIDGVSESGVNGDAAIVSAIVGMSWAMGKRVIPEGIETADQVDALRRIGCGIGQGYFFAKPMPADEFEAWLRRPAASGADSRSPAAAATAASASGLPASALRVLRCLENQLPDDAAIWVGHLDYDMEARRVVVTAGDESFGLAAGVEAPIEESLCHLLAHGRGPELCASVAESPYARLESQSALAVGSFVGQPIVADGRIVGTLCAIAHRQDAFDEQHLEWLAMGALVLTASLQAAGHRGADLQQQLRRAAFEAQSATAVNGASPHRSGLPKR